ncbi:hypothetical protein [Achromobacter deleyi]|uniref:hypothetical protein n=1 Tax=Achromobacter deleyi TaxID=1353891 RepID=UPI001583B14C|nr:hypothetical protein [Achromobacter deleyi]
MESKSSLEDVNGLLSDLLRRRESVKESKLCKILRGLSPDEKFLVIEKLSEGNVRMAASVAARINFPEWLLSDLFVNVLKRGGSNEIKQYVAHLFVHRMAANKMLGVLKKNKGCYSKSVRFAAYYLSKSGSISEKSRAKFLDIFDSVKNDE